MTHFKHLTLEDRYTIRALLRNQNPLADIARQLSRSTSTISREIKRGGMTRDTYDPGRAHAHRKAVRPPSPHRKPQELWLIVEKYLCEQQWSPEQISGYLKSRKQPSASHEAIYHHVYADKDKRGRIKHRVPINERPAVVDEKKRLGDFEMDTVIGIPGGPVLVTIVDRCSKYTLVGLAASKQADDVGATILTLLRGHKETAQTLTYDNGKEFAYHHILNDLLGVESYFAHPYHSWERGLNENTNGLIRQYFPKKSDFSLLDSRQVRHVQNLLNSRPRKTLYYSTPDDIYYQQDSVALPS
jgi:IS30 family transposase